MSRKNPFLGLGIYSWSQGFSRITQIPGSVVFDGSGDYLSIPDSTDSQFGSEDFTIEGWIYVNNFNTERVIISKWGPNSPDQEFSFRVDIDGRLRIFLNNSGGGGVNSYTSGSTVLQTQTWYHVAVSKNGGAVYMYVDGVLVTNSGFGGSVQSSGSDTLVGCVRGSTFQQFYDGNISNLRVIKGTGLYPSAFTVPTQPLKATFRELNSVAFDGDDGLSAAYDSSFNPGTSDFTIEAFVKYSGTIATDYTVFNIKDGNNQGINVRIGDSSGFVIVKYSYAGQGFSGSGNATGVTLTESVWNHIAFVKSPGDIKIFVNGQQAISTSFVNPGSFNYSGQAPPFYIGVGNGGNVNYFNGSISNVRFVIGNALYTSSFTPPTAPLENITNTVLLACNSSNPTTETTGKTVTVIGDPSTITDTPFNTTASLLCCQSSTSALEEATGKEISLIGDAEASEFNPFSGA